MEKNTNKLVALTYGIDYGCVFTRPIYWLNIHYRVLFRDGPLENLVGRGGGRSTKTYSLKEKLNEQKFMA